jgi:hypothetical protein
VEETLLPLVSRVDFWTSGIFSKPEVIPGQKVRFEEAFRRRPFAGSPPRTPFLWSLQLHVEAEVPNTYSAILKMHS